MKPSIPKGTRDFSPAEVARRKYIFDTIRSVFETYGYQPIETPVMENLSTLTGKYGEEGDKLLFKVLNNGDFLAKADETALAEKNSTQLVASISKRGLRYDLTVPFARYVVMYQHELSFPFKRYQIQPVWRADRPQKGRYQEFYQCDADVVGSDSLMYESELALIYDKVFTTLGIPVVIHLNNRKLLHGIAEVAGIPDRMMDMTLALDKLDKIGWSGVHEEMAARGIPGAAAQKIEQILQSEGLEGIAAALEGSAMGSKGVEELRTVFRYLETTPMTQQIKLDLTLARGLNYYTGCIFEVKATEVAMGSIGGGGRYDDLTGIFGMPGVSGVGISFGAERIYDVMLEMGLFPAHNPSELQLLIMAFDEAAHLYAFQCLQFFRSHGIAADLYPEPGKLKKQMKYANARQVPFVALAGETEMQAGQLSLKNMESGTQELLGLEDMLVTLQKARE